MLIGRKTDQSPGILETVALLGNKFPGNCESYNGESNHTDAGAKGPPSFLGDFVGKLKRR